MAFVQLDDVFARVWIYLLLCYDESCVIIFAFIEKPPHFLAFFQFHLSTSISGMLPDIFLCSFSVTESSFCSLCFS